MTRWQLTGVLLWRGGLLFATLAAFYYGAWHLVETLRLPTQLTTGLALASTGLALVMVSLVLERRKDALEGEP